LTLKTKTRLITFIIFATSFRILSAQQFHFKQYTTEDGLNSNNVYDMYKDSSGRLLLATDKGLNILNGSTFYSLTDQGSYIGFYIDSLVHMLTHRGNIMLLEHDDRISSLKYNRLIKDSIGSNPVHGIIRDGNGYFLSIGTLSHVDHKGFQKLYRVTYTNQNQLSLISVLFKKENSGMISFRNFRELQDTFNQLHVMNFPISSRNSYFGLKHGHFDKTHYFGFAQTIFSSNKDSWSLRHILKDEIISILSPTQKIIYVGTYNGKVYAFNIKTQEIKPIFSSSHQPITAILRENQNTLWVSTEGGGLFRVNTFLKRTLPHIPIDASHIFFTPTDTLYERQGKIMQSRTNHARYNTVPVEIQINKSIKVNSSFSFSKSFRFLMRAPNDIYIGCFYGGIHKYKTSGNFIQAGQYSRIDDIFTSGEIIDSSFCLLGSYSGLYKYKYNEKLDFTLPEVNDLDNFNKLDYPRLKSKRINAIQKTNKSNFLIGTHDQGLFFLNIIAHKKPIKVQCIKRNHISDILEIESGTFLINSESSISIIKEISTGNFKLLNTLKLPVIRKIYHKDSHLYLSTYKGIYKSKIKDLIRSYPIQLSIRKENLKFAWNETSKNITWNCSTTDIPNNNDLFKIQLIQNRDTQNFFTSQNQFNLKGFAHGSYQGSITINPELGGICNPVFFNATLCPPWYLNNISKGIYLLSALLLAALIIYFITLFYKRKYASQNERANLELAAVRNVLKPHYMHNTLNTLQSIAYFKDFEKLNSYVSKLSKWLRLSLQDNDHQVIDLNKEIKLIISFLELEKMKLEHGLKYLILDQTSLTNSFKVPFFILQPIVENTLKYSYLKSKNPQLTIQINEDQNQLIIHIMDNGHGEAIHNKNSTKTGVSIINRKLELFDILTKSNKKSTHTIQFKKGIGCYSKLIIQKSKQADVR